jgi:hypothetical protein
MAWCDPPLRVTRGLWSWLDGGASPGPRSPNTTARGPARHTHLDARPRGTGQRCTHTRRTLRVRTTIARNIRSRFDYRMRVTAAFALRLILPKKHNDVKMTQNHSKQLPNTLPSAQMNGHMKGDKGTHFRPLTLSPMSHMPASDIGEPG